MKTTGFTFHAGDLRTSLYKQVVSANRFSLGRTNNKRGLIDHMKLLYFYVAFTFHFFFATFLSDLENGNVVLVKMAEISDDFRGRGYFGRWVNSLP